METLYGRQLRELAKKIVGKTLPRDQVDSVVDFIRNGDMRYIGVVSGLSMTGKTNLLCHVMLKMTDEEIANTGFIVVSPNDTWDSLDAEMRKMKTYGACCILIDEITEVKNFINKAVDLANIFSNVYGIRIICSGSWSLALYFAEYSSRVSMKSKFFDLTFLPFDEWHRLLQGLDSNGKYTILEYMSHGGILGTLDEMKLKRANYDFNTKNWKPDVTFPFGRWKDNKEFYDKYFGAAIVNNLQNGLICRAIADKEFVNIASMFHKKIFTDIIQRIVCDIHHAITNEFFDRENFPYIVNDIYRNLHEKGENYPAEILMSEDFYEYMEKRMGICFSSNDKISDKEKKEIVSYLKKMHVLADIDVETTLPSIDVSHRVILTLPGMRRQFCDEMMHFFQNYTKDEYWNCLDDAEKEKTINTVKGAFYGRIFEDCILYECMCRAEKEAEESGVALRVYRFENSRQDAGPDSPWGEFDMVIRASCGGWTRYALFEAKCTASARMADRHCQQLRKEDLLRAACPDGLVALRAVLYNGGPLEVPGGVSAIPGPIRYLNASQFLVDVARHGLLALFGADRPRSRLDAVPENGEAPLPECMAAEGADSASRQAPVFPASSAVQGPAGKEKLSSWTADEAEEEACGPSF